MSVVSTAATVVQLLAVGKELMDLWDEGKISEEEFISRWNRNAGELTSREERWRARQEEKRLRREARSTLGKA